MIPLADATGAAAALASVLALILLAGRVARAGNLPGLLGQFMPPLTAGKARQETRPALRLRGTLALDSRRRLHIVDGDESSVLVLTGGAQDVLLAWPPRAP